EGEVSRDDQHRLADRAQRDDRSGGEDLLDVRRAEEAVVVDRRRRDDDREREHDPELAEAEEELGERVRARRRRQDLRFLGDSGHAASSSTRPVAACMIASSVASALANSRMTRPSNSTTMRSAIPSTSGSSDEIIRTATPRAASSDSSRCTSAFVPTSMPRVGSSTMINLGLRASHFASTVFCWLPPESVQTGLVRRPYFSWSRIAQSRANLRSAPPGIRPPLRTSSSGASGDVP